MKHFPLLISALLLLPVAATADSVLLRNGTEIKGRIIQQNSASIVIVTNGRRQTIAKSTISRVFYNNDIGDDSAAEEERQRKEEERLREEQLRKQQEEQRKREEERKKAEEKRQQEVLKKIEQDKLQKEEEQKAEESRLEEQRLQEEERKREEEQRRAEEESRRNQSNEGNPFLSSLNRNELRIRLDGGAGRVRSLFDPAAKEIEYLQSVFGNGSAVWSSDPAEKDGLAVGLGLEYNYDRFLFRAFTRRLASAYSVAEYTNGTATDSTTGLTVDAFTLQLNYYNDVRRFDHSLGLGYTLFSNSWLELRPLIDYTAQITEEDAGSTSYSFRDRTFNAFYLGTTSHRQWLRGPQGGLEALLKFRALGQDLQWRLYAGAIQLQGSAVSDTSSQVYGAGGSFQGLRTFRVDPKIFYEGIILETALYYQLASDWRVYVSLAGQTGQANATDLNIAQNFSGLSPEEMYFSLYNFNQNMKIGGLRDHHSRFDVGVEYLLGF